MSVPPILPPAAPDVRGGGSCALRGRPGGGDAFAELLTGGAPPADPPAMSGRAAQDAGAAAGSAAPADAADLPADSLADLPTEPPADPPTMSGRAAQDAGTGAETGTEISIEPPTMSGRAAQDGGAGPADTTSDDGLPSGIGTAAIPLSVVTALGAAALEAAATPSVTTASATAKPLRSSPAASGRAATDAAAAVITASRAFPVATSAATPTAGAPTPQSVSVPATTDVDGELSTTSSEGAAGPPTSDLSAPGQVAGGDTTGIGTVEASATEAPSATSTAVDRPHGVDPAGDPTDPAVDPTADRVAAEAPPTSAPAAGETGHRSAAASEQPAKAPATVHAAPSSGTAAITGLRVHDGSANTGTRSGRDRRPGGASGEHRTDLPAAAAVGVTATTRAAYASGDVEGSTNAITGQVFPEVARLVSRGDGMRRLTVKLNPEALGEVRVVLTVRNGDVHVRMTGSQAAHQALLNGAPELHRLLDRVGAASSQIVVGDGSTGSQSTDRGAAHQQTRHEPPAYGAQDGTPGDAGRHPTDHRTAGTRDGSTTSARDGATGGTRPRSSTDPAADGGVTRIRDTGVDVTM